MSENVIIKEMMYNDKAEVKNMAKTIYEKFKNSGKEKIVIVNIGSSKIAGDMIGPLTGSFLIQSDIEFAVYGTMDYPITAINIPTRLPEIKEDHKDDFIIAIDAAVSSDKTTKKGLISLKNRPIYPGKGIGRDLETIGDISINVTVEYVDVDDDPFKTINKLHEASFSFISCICETIKNIIIYLDKEFVLDSIK